MDARERVDTPALVILGVAVGVRVAALVATRHLALVNDPADYQRLAVSLVHGHGFGTTVVAPGGGPTAFRPPLWPLFLAGVYAVTGVHLLAARLVEVALGTLTVGLIGALAGRLWDGRARLVAMAVAAVYPPLVLAGASLLSESLSLPLMLGTLLAARAAGRAWHDRGDARRSLLWSALAGALAGLDVLCRPDSFVVLLPALLLALWEPLGRRRASALGVRRVGRWRRSAVLVGAALLVVAPWLVRDAVVMGRFVPVTTQGGLVASGTYNDTAAHDRAHPAAWRPANLVPAYVPLLKGTEVQEEEALRSASLRYIRSHPLYPFRVAWWNLRRLFDTAGVAPTQASWAANGIRPGLGILDAWGLGALAVLGVGAAAAGWVRRRGRPSVLPPFRPGTRAVWWAPVLLALVTVAVLGESRLRVGLDPFLVLLAAGAVTGALTGTVAGASRAVPGQAA